MPSARPQQASSTHGLMGQLPCAHASACGSMDGLVDLTCVRASAMLSLNRKQEASQVARCTYQLPQTVLVHSVGELLACTWKPPSIVWPLMTTLRLDSDAPGASAGVKVASAAGSVLRTQASFEPSSNGSSILYRGREQSTPSAARRQMTQTSRTTAP
eukprot:CAMPEP_0174714774 /NCGR_PEP_ID=MMETSP1094-20130205/19169_1 /TAXON_ID=156173 /ORGANISM="Chrysochromulina brevifilum, Strain UTEX LB 985" /LENGTH=157 /DNA_ID=CAMNT_0015914209 /DNA_START=221 /DNA_END=695 /DNA_ORIENTATION=-